MLHERTQILIGEHGLASLWAQRMLIVGLGGVGGAVLEALARANIGHLTLVDHDRIGLSNANRQLIALSSTLAQSKAEVAAARVHDINPLIEVDVRPDFLHPENIPVLLEELRPSYVLDCIDSVVCKAALVAAAQQQGIPVVSSMGAGGRLDVRQAKMTTLAQTEGCGLARAMRARLRKLGASLDYPVVFSTEKAVNALPHAPIPGDAKARPRAVNGTISYLPNLFGFMLAGFVIEEVLNKEGQ